MPNNNELKPAITFDNEPKPAITFYDNSPINIPIPQPILNKSIGDFLYDKNTDLSIRNGQFSMRTTQENFIITIQSNMSQTGRTKSIYSSIPIPTDDKKTYYIENIKQMLKEGMLQKDIAFELGISPSYVNQLIKNYLT